MSEERTVYETATDNTRWADVRFADGKHTGVRVLRGTTIIEVKRDGRQTIVDVASCAPLDLAAKQVYDG